MELFLTIASYQFFKNYQIYINYKLFLEGNILYNYTFSNLENKLIFLTK